MVGVWCSDQLLNAHDTAGDARARGPLLQWCSAITSGGGCDAVAASPWADVTLPVLHRTLPVALMGWGYFAGLGLWYLLNGSARSTWRVRRWMPLIVAAGGLYASIFFVSLMAFGRVPWCAACLLTHLINVLLIVAIAFDAFPRRIVPSTETRLAQLRRPAVVLLLTLTLLLLLDRGRTAAQRARVLAIDLTPYQRMVESMREQAPVLLAAYRAQPVVTIPHAAGDLSPAKEHRLVVFTDMECPACAANTLAIDNVILPLYGQRLSVEFRHYPLCVECNPSARNVHPDACAAAYAAEAVRQLAGQTAFSSMIQSLHRSRDQLSPELYDALASDLHLPLDRFHAAMNGAAVHDAVKADIELAKSLIVTQTPTLFLDGRRVPQVCMTNLFWETIAQEK